MNRARTLLVGVLVTVAAWTVYAGDEGGAPVEEPAPTNQAFRVEAPPDGLRVIQTPCRCALRWSEAPTFTTC
jgi:hypothetical protein